MADDKWDQATKGEETPRAQKERQLDQFERERLWRAMQLRHRAGYAIGALAIAGIIALACRTLYEIQRAYGLVPANELQARFHLVLVGAHAVVVIAMVFFAYQLLRAAERLIIPYELAKESPELMQAMLGVEGPQAQVLEKVTKLVGSAIEKK